MRSDQAMHGGITGAGTDEDAINKIYEQTRSEVEAEAARKGWSTAQMEAEIKRATTRSRQSMKTNMATQTASWRHERSAERAARRVQVRALGCSNSTSPTHWQTMTSSPPTRRGSGSRRNPLSPATRPSIRCWSRSTRARARTSSAIRPSTCSSGRDRRAARQAVEPRAMGRGAARRPGSEIESNGEGAAKLNMSKLENTFDEKYSRFGKGGLPGPHRLQHVGRRPGQGLEPDQAGRVLEPAQEIFYAVNGIGTDVDALKRILKGKSPRRSRGNPEALEGSLSE